MAHFARINKESVVIYVTPIPNEMITDENGIEHENLALGHLYNTLPDSIEDFWIQTSYNNNFRVRFAQPGFTYDQTLDAFIPPKPYPSWIINKETKDWESPIGSEPILTQEQINNKLMYKWDEENLKWILE
jgi:hypothetical protein